MNSTSEIKINNTSVIGNIIGYMFGILSLAVGLINTFWGNDPGYGIFIILLSFVFFAPATAFFKKISGISIPLILKIILAAFIIWTAMGVAELPDKIDIMLRDFNS